MSTAANKAGKVMLVLAWISGLALATYWFGRFEQKQANPNAEPYSVRQDDVVEVHLKRNHQHHFVASGRINGASVAFLLDTGATDVSIGLAEAKRLGLVKGAQVSLHTANGTSIGYRTQLHELRLGEITLTDVRALIAPGMTGSQVLLGMSALQQLEFTQRDGTLVLRHYPKN